MNKYQIKEILGAGKYGRVSKAIDTTTQNIVAIKEINVESENEGIPITTLREIILLKGIKHKNVVDLLDTIVDQNNNKIYLVLEFMDCDLHTYFLKNPTPNKVNLIAQ